MTNATTLKTLQTITTEFGRMTQGRVGIAVQGLSDPALHAGFSPSIRFPSASVIKIAVACAAFDAHADGVIDLAGSVRVGTLDTTDYPSALVAFQPDDTLSLFNLVGLMLIISDNSATTALLNRVGRERVNRWLDEHELSKAHIHIGFEDRYLGDPLRANTITALECLRLLRATQNQERYAPIRTMLANNVRNQRLPKRLPDRVTVAHKTGSLNGVVNDIGVVTDGDTAYRVAVLSEALEDTPTFEARLSIFAERIHTLMTDHQAGG